MQIRGYEDFCRALEAAGFSMAGANASGIYTVIPFDWNQDVGDSPLRWHTGDPDTDPWQWRMRVLNERDDVAYGKLFFGKGGYLMKNWYAPFICARRKGLSAEAAYADGILSRGGLSIYRCLAENRRMSAHALRSAAGFQKDGAGFTKGLVELQMKMYIVTSGEAYRIGLDGLPMGWPSNEYVLGDDFFGGAVDEAMEMDIQGARALIERQVLALNPDAQANKIRKFIDG